MIATDSIPPLLLAAYEAAPDDFTLVAAMADAAAEAGDDLTAEALRWVEQKRRCPKPVHGGGAWFWDSTDSSWSDLRRMLPFCLRDRYNLANGDLAWSPYGTCHTRLPQPWSTLLQRLVRAWAAATAEERAAAWEWQPKLRKAPWEKTTA